MAACCPPNLGLKPFEVLCLACDKPGTPLEMNFTATTFMRRELKDGDVLELTCSTPDGALDLGVQRTRVSYR